MRSATNRLLIQFKIQYEAMSKDLNTTMMIHGEMIKNKGEDSFSEYILENRGYMGVYDGCGGIGSKRYANAGGSTGAYLSSRFLALKMYEWVREHAENENFINQKDSEKIGKYLQKHLTAFRTQLDTGNPMGVKGGLSISLPSTAAMFFYQCREEDVITKFLWAGDSRGYILDMNGLAQITADDVDDRQDAFSNLTNDSKLENVVNADKDFVINEKDVALCKPCILLVSSDGVFGYIPTPMEFEYMLLATLEQAGSFDEWQKRMSAFIKEYASDDYTLGMAVIGFDDFEMVKNYYTPRTRYLYSRFIKPIEEGRAAGSRSDLKKYWEIYRPNYSRYLTGTDSYGKNI